jgi:hypothetical protein
LIPALLAKMLYIYYAELATQEAAFICNFTVGEY